MGQTPYWEVSASQAESNARVRAEQSGLVASLSLPPDGYLPAAVRKEVQGLREIESKANEGRVELTRLRSETGAVSASHREAIATAMLSDKPLPKDPGPAHDNAIRAAEDFMEGGRLAHIQAVGRVWDKVDQVAPDQVVERSEQLAAKRSRIVDVLASLADECHEAAEIEATLRFYAESENRRPYSSQGSALARQLRALANEVDVPVLAPSEHEEHADA